MSETRETTTAAFVGTVGGAGTTRTTLEFAAALAADGRSVVVLDVAFATQGLAGYVEGTVAPDATALVTDAADDPLAAGLFEPTGCAGLAGRVACCPAHAPFERVARAMTPAAAERFESRVGEAAADADAVLVDVPPVASNPAVAAVTAVDRSVLVAPASRRGRDGVQRASDRLADLGAEPSAVVSTFGNLAGADAGLPHSEATAAADVPACLDGPSEYAAAVGEAAETVLGVDLDVSFEDGGRLDRVGGLFSNGRG
jgi:cellulose biosynthesis protein BcsQ